MNKVNDFAVKAFYTLYIVAFGIIAFFFFVWQLRKFDASFVLTAISCGIVLCLMAAAYYLISKYINILGKSYYKILPVFSLIYFIVLISIGLNLRYDPMFDLSAVYNNAIEFATKGSFATQDYNTASKDYFYYFPNNIGGVYFFSFFFSVAHFLGFNDYFAVAVISNSLLITTTFYLCVLITKRLYGVKASFMFLAALLFMPALWHSGAVFYTDFLSIIFPFTSLYLYLRIINYDSSVVCESGINSFANSNKFEVRDKTAKKNNDVNLNVKKILLIIFLSAVVALGSLVKFTTVIMPIAILIICLLSKRYKAFFAIAISCAIAMLLANAIMSNSSEKFLDEEISYQLNTPYTHWVMMGLKGIGRYNGEDYTFTRSFTDIELRNQSINEEIFDRIYNLGPVGLGKLWLEKTNIFMTDGTFGMSDFLNNGPANTNFMHKYVIYHSEYYSLYKSYCDGAYLAMQLLCLLACLAFLLKKNNDAVKIAVYLCAFGGMVFFSAWEVTGRYFTNLMPCIIIGACALFSFSEIINKKTYEIFKKAIKK